MALFNASALLDDTPESKEIICDFFRMPEGEEFPVLSVKMTDKLRDVYRRADDRYRFSPRYVFKKGEGAIGEVSNNPVQFCHEILNEGYESSRGLVDDPTKKVILALLKREPLFARKLAAKLVEIFEHDELYAEQENDEKN